MVERLFISVDPKDHPERFVEQLGIAEDKFWGHLYRWQYERNLGAITFSGKLGFPLLLGLPKSFGNDLKRHDARLRRRA